MMCQQDAFIFIQLFCLPPSISFPVQSENYNSSTLPWPARAQKMVLSLLLPCPFTLPFSVSTRPPPSCAGMTFHHEVSASMRLSRELPDGLGKTTAPLSSVTLLCPALFFIGSAFMPPYPYACKTLACHPVYFS